MEDLFIVREAELELALKVYKEKLEEMRVATTQVSKIIKAKKL